MKIAYVPQYLVLTLTPPILMAILFLPSPSVSNGSFLQGHKAPLSLSFTHPSSCFLIKSKLIYKLPPCRWCMWECKGRETMIHFSGIINVVEGTLRGVTVYEKPYSSYLRKQVTDTSDLNKQLISPPFTVSPSAIDTVLLK